MQMRDLIAIESARKDTLEARRKLRGVVDRGHADRQLRQLLDRELRALALVTGMLAGALERLRGGA